LVDGVVISEVETIACRILAWQGYLPYQAVQDFVEYVVAVVGWVSVSQVFEHPSEEFEYSEANVAVAGRVDWLEQGCFSERQVDPGEGEAIERKKEEIANQVYEYPVKAMEVVVGVLQQHYQEVWLNLVSMLWQEGQGAVQLGYQEAA
jgi:hypothetical protein